MQISKIMLAVAALTIGASAFAAPPSNRIAFSSGASATKGNLKTALNTLCTNAGGVMTEFTSGGNISTYVCADVLVGSAASTSAVATDAYGTATFKNFDGTNFAELRLNVNGGSFTAVCALNFLNNTNGNTTWTGQPATPGAGADTACATVNANGAADKYRDPTSTTTAFRPSTTFGTVVGGLMDVQPDTWPTSVTQDLTLSSADPTSVAQTFGVVASDKLYRAMYKQQLSSGAATIDKPIPSSCGSAPLAVTGKLECIPTISKGQMATIMANNEFNSAYSNGAGFLADVDPDTNASLTGTELQYNRRANTSGTQASAQAYFLGLPCMTNPLTIVDAPAVGSSTVVGAVRVFAHAGTGNVRAQLNTSGVYGIGIISGENNQVTGSVDGSNGTTSWKWLRVQGAPIGENAAPGSAGITNSASVTNGTYDFFYESKSVGDSAFWGAVTTQLNSLTAPVGLLNSTDLQAYNKGNSACQFNAKSN